MGDAHLGLDVLDRLGEGIIALRWPSWQKFFSASVLAESYASAGHLQRARELLRALTGESAGSCMAPELPRLQGELLMRLDKPDPAQAERCLREAIALARRQEAKSFELRAATSLARILLQTGRRDEAREAVAPTYAWFTEGFDTADLKSAHALLGELGEA